jgi:glycerophosphoryl diester phosphodiesterase
MRIWAHRGCSQLYPENTLLAFEKAAAVQNLTGIELDIQITKDGELVVIHDERVDRTTEGIGFVRDYTLSQLKKLHIYADSHPSQMIPTMNEVFDMLEQKLKTGFRLNIELKNGIFPYDGMEEKIVELVHKRGLQEAVVYSTFYAKSLEKLRKADKNAELGILDSRVSDCLYKAKGGCGAVALHPFWKSIDLTAQELEGYTVRAWMSGHLYPEKPTGGKLDLAALERQGITDIILNEPEVYKT